MEHGPDVSVDALSEPNELTIKRMVIRDAKVGRLAFISSEGKGVGPYL